MFDFTKVQDENLIPPGTYNAKILKAEWRENKKNYKNKSLVITFGVRGKVNTNFFWHLNLINDNEQAQSIAQRQCKGLLEALGRPLTYRDEKSLAQNLSSGNVIIEVDNRRDNNGNLRTQIKKFLKDENFRSE